MALQTPQCADEVVHDRTDHFLYKTVLGLGHNPDVETTKMALLASIEMMFLCKRSEKGEH